MITRGVDFPRCSCAVLSYVLLAIVASASACQRDQTNAQDCQEIFEHIAKIEIREMGFRDPELEARNIQMLRKKFAENIKECEGMPVTQEAMECMRRAENTEELSHSCF